MPDYSELASAPLFQNPPLQWLIAGGVAIGVYLVLTTVRRMIRSYYLRMKVTPETEWLELPLQVLSRTTSISFFIWSIFLRPVISAEMPAMR